MSGDIKILNKILASQVPQNSKRIMHHDQMSFVTQMQVQYNTCKPIHCINRMRAKII